MKRTVPWVLTFVAGGLMIADYFVPHRRFAAVVQELQQWGLIVVAFTYVLGIANVFELHSKKIARRSADWGYSIVLVVCMSGMAALGIFHGYDQPGSPFL